MVAPMRWVVVGCTTLVVLMAGCGGSTRPRSTVEKAGGAQIGIASWYGPGFHGNRTSSGEVYDQYDLTAAHQTLPLGTTVSVTNLNNGRQVEVRVNDRGPFAKDRIIDLSYAAARNLDMIGPGTAPVRVEPVSDGGLTFAALAYTLQVGSFADRANAVRLQNQLASRFEGVYLAPAAGGDHTYYRVRLGKFSRREDAKHFAQSVSTLGLPVIVVEDGRAR
jgi:rare lipoprotein A